MIAAPCAASPNIIDYEQVPFTKVMTYRSLMNQNLLSNETNLRRVTLTLMQVPLA